MHQTHHDEAIDWLYRINRVATRDGNPGGSTDGLPAIQNLADRRGRQHADRHPDKSQGHDRRTAHRVNIADGVGRCDPTKVERIVHDRHEEVGRGDERLLVIEKIDRCVVRGLNPDKKLGGHRHCRSALENFTQNPGSNLAPASSAMRKTREAGLMRVR